MIKSLTISAGGATHQQLHAQALAAGLRRHGVAVTVVGSADTVRTPHAACWGWRRGARLRDAGHDVLVMERGYVGDRFAWTSLGWNGLNGRASFPAGDGERFARHFRHLYRPWSPAGRYVLLVGQVPGDASLQGRDLRPWYQQAAIAAEKAYGLPVLFRPHPQAVDRGIAGKVPGVATLAGTLEAAIAGAAVVVTWNSNTGVDALLAGKPVVAMDRGSMAWPLAARDVPEATAVEPWGRLAWAEGLAWCQWRLEEIEDGSALEHVLGALRDR